jgi:hypothetical protein
MISAYLKGRTDVSVLYDEEREQMQCVACVRNIEHRRNGLAMRTTARMSPPQMLRHLQDHRKGGDVVPDKAFGFVRWVLSGGGL